MDEVQADPSRRLELTGCFNFRDLGGYETADGRRIRWRTLFRADGLSRLDEADCAQLSELGLATVIDLRTLVEADERGRLPEHAFEVEYHHLPLTDVLPPEDHLARYSEPAFVGERYSQLLAGGSEAIGRALEILAAPRALPAVFHCSAGKDRTGVLAALVLGFLGVPDEVIIEDYALSAQAMERLLEKLRQDYADNAEAIERYAPAVISAYPEAMSGFLALLREEHGDFERLAESLGVSAFVGALRSSLLS